MRGILGKKVGMTQLFDKSGAVIPVTIIEAGPCYVTQVKTNDTDKYNAVQLGYDEVAERKLTKGERGHLKQAGAPTLRRLRELRYDQAPDLKVGDVDQGRHLCRRRDGRCRRRLEGPRLLWRSEASRFRMAAPRPTASLTAIARPASRGAGTTPGHTMPGKLAPGQFGNTQSRCRT
jgi:large subunit ribosomal protein L3